MTQESPQQYRKVKLKLIQPQIVCAGRQRVTCHYRGKVISETEESMIIEFKVYGVVEQALYLKEEKRFAEEVWQDLKIINDGTI